MRFLEVSFLLCSLIGLLSLLWRAPDSRMQWLALLAPVTAVLQVLVEGARWQLAPAYACAACLAIAFLAAGRVRHARFAKVLMAAAGILALGAASALAVLFPVFSFPAPNGPFAVGTFAVQWIDASRADVFAANPASPRILVAQIYYPAAANAAGRRALYLANAGRVSVQLMKVLGFPAFLVSHLRYVTTNAIENALPAKEAFQMPVLIFLSGADGFRNTNYAQVQSLASQGYVVVCLDQPGTAASVHLEDGRDVDAIPRPLMQRLIDQSVNPAALPVPSMNGRSFPEGVIGYLAQDAVFARQQLQDLNMHSLLAGRLNLQQVGLFGVSLGGIEAAEACSADPGFRACLIMESPMTRRALAEGLGQPAMFITRSDTDMRIEGWPQAEIDRHLNGMGRAFAGLRGGGYLLQILGAYHANFGDAAFWSPLVKALGVTGPIDGERCEKIVEAYQLAFFESHLRGLQAPLLAETPAAYREVIFKARH